LILQETVAGKIPQALKDIIARPEDSNTLLLYGPEGGGKTKIIQTLAKIRGAKLLTLNGGDVLTKYQGSATENLQEFFKYAQELAELGENIVIFIDEVDAIFSLRSGLGHCEDRTAGLTSFGGLLEKIHGNKQLFFAAATNRYSALDKLFTSRIRDQIEIPLPDWEDRKDILSKLLKSDPHCSTNSCIAALASATNDFSGRDLEGLILKARRSKNIEGNPFLLPPHIKMHLKECSKVVKIATHKRKMEARKNNEELSEPSFLSKHGMNMLHTALTIAGLVLGHYHFYQNTKLQKQYRAEDTLLQNGYRAEDALKAIELRKSHIIERCADQLMPLTHAKFDYVKLFNAALTICENPHDIIERLASKIK